MSFSLAAVFAGPRSLEIQSFATPLPQGEEILVRVLGCTVCGSDLHTLDGRRAAPTPSVLGHEVVGMILARGDSAPQQDLAGQDLRIGDRIAWAVVAHCGECFYCLRGLPQKCLQAVKYGHEPLRPGRELLGGLAEHCLLVRGTSIVRLPDDLPLAVACPASCATSTVEAALDSGGELGGQTVCILGAGLLGLTACAMCQVRGAKVICSDLNPGRLERAKRFGAAHVAIPTELAAVVCEVTSGHGVDLVLELTGANSAFEAAWPLVRLGGRITLVGSVFPTPHVSISLEQIVRRNLTIGGIHNYSPSHLLKAIKFLTQHHRSFPFGELVTVWHPLQHAQVVLLQPRETEVIRIGFEAKDD